MAKATQRALLTQLTAPVPGAVQQLAVRPSGGVVTLARMLLVAVPHDAELTVEVAVDNKDGGFVQKSKSVAVKLETFPHTRDVTVPAGVTTITADAVSDEKRDRFSARCCGAIERRWTWTGGRFNYQRGWI